MPKYFFHLDRPGGELADTAGAELVDDQHALRVANRIVRKLRESERYDYTRWVMSVRNAQDEVVVEVPLGALH
jgi:hypothetical protein